MNFTKLLYSFLFLILVSCTSPSATKKSVQTLDFPQKEEDSKNAEVQENQGLEAKETEVLKQTTKTKSKKN